MKLQKQIGWTVMYLLVIPQPGFGAELSPSRWTATERKQAEQGEMTPWPAQAKMIAGQSGLVAGTMSPIAVRAGVEALRQGGTAADAAATVAFTQITTALGSYVSYAGIWNWSITTPRRAKYPR